MRISVLASAADRYASQGISLITIAIMSRILTPAETGLYMVANAFIILSDNFRTFGIGIYIVQEATLDRRAVRSAFTVTLALSLVVGLTVCGMADRIAAFYGEPELASLLSISALVFVVLPFGSPILALLQRELAFRTLALLNVAAALANSAVTIGLGFAGIGPASYVWGNFAASMLLVVLAVLVRPEPWIFRPSLSGARRVVAFGVTSSAVVLLNMVCDLLPRLAFGRLLGFDAVGLYARAVTICQLPDRVIVSGLQPVVLPAMAARVRAGGDLRDAYLRGHALMSAIQWPTLLLLVLLADPAVRVLLGSQWAATVPLVRTIALATMALAPGFMTFPVLVASGRVRDTLISSLIALPGSALLTIVSARFGLAAVAASLLFTAPFQIFVALIFVRRAIGLEWRELAKASRESALLTLGAAAIPALIVLLSPHGAALVWGETAVALAGAGAGWLTALWLTDHPIRHELTAVLRLLVGGIGGLVRGRTR